MPQPASARPRRALAFAALAACAALALVAAPSAAAPAGAGASAAPAGPPLPDVSVPAAKVSSQRVEYELRLGDKVVGKREVTVRHVPGPGPEAPETRILESWTEIQAEVAGKLIKVRQRATARANGSRLQFTAVNDENGRVSEVQGRRLADGRWLMTIIDSSGSRSFEYRKSQVDLCTLDLLDPELHRRLVDRPTARLLLVETGDVIEGPAKDLGEATLKVGGVELPVTRSTFTPSEGRLTMDWNLEGLLVAYEIGFLGQRLSAQVRTPPAPRVWGEVAVPLRFGAGREVGEGEL